MNNKKSLIMILLTIFILIIPFSLLKFSHQIEINNLDYSAVANATKYYDWSATSSGPLSNGYLSNAYSYSTIYYTNKTQIVILENSGELTYHATTDNIKLPFFNKIKDGEVKFLITNCAVNSKGELLDVVVRVHGVKKWTSDSYVWIKLAKYANLLDSQLKPGSINENGYNKREKLGVGTPISFLLHTEGEGAECTITIKYYKTGTYNKDTNKGTAGGITNAIGFFSDIDVTYGAGSSSRFLTGIEGFAPTTGSSFIFYNKNGKKVADSTNWNIKLKELDNGITVSSATKPDVNAFWYQSAAFIATKDLSNSTYSFKYGGKGCGMWFMFSSPYPYQINAPSKTSTKTELSPGQQAIYKISQYVPNNYYGKQLNYAEVYPKLVNNTLFTSFKITDTIDSNLTIDTASIKVKNDANEDLTDWFNITVKSNVVTATAKSAKFNTAAFYNRMYTLEIPVTLKTNVSKATISNSASTTTKLGSETAKTLSSSKVDMKVFFNITVKHLEKGTDKVLASSSTIKTYYGKEYTTSKSSNVSTNYQLVSTPTNATGTATKNDTVTYYYKLKESTLTVHHYIEGTTTKLTDSEVSTVYWGNTYNTSASSKVSSNYEYSSVKGTTSGTVAGNITVIYYYKQKSSTLTVHHYIDGTTTKLADDQISTVYYGNKYSTEIHPNIPENYELKTRTSNFSGVVNSKTIEVTYYYQKKDSSLETSITKIGPEEITKKDEPVDYTITYKVKTTDYIGNGTITIVDTLPYHINLDQSNIDNGTYNEETNTITWTIPWNGIDSYNGKGETTITKNISLIYTDIIATDRIMINSVNGTIKLENNSREKENQSITNIHIPGKITIHYYIKDTQVELEPSVEMTKLVGEQVETTFIEKEGYIIHKPEVEVYTLTEEPQEVIYEYEKIKFNITTRVEGIGGTISGDEEVEYGDSSTEDNIVITPDEGYLVDTVFINGEKYELTDEEKERLILNNITNIKEDYEIVVRFTIDTRVLPSTGAFANFIYILIVIFSTLIILLKIKKNKMMKIN